MNNGWGYLFLFGILSAPFVFWCYSRISKTIKDNYKDEFDKCQERSDFNGLL